MNSEGLSYIGYTHIVCLRPVEQRNARNVNGCEAPALQALIVVREQTAL